ncbi:MAG TPA: hypothetical protein VFU47_04250 [Armatimonadota bacterium]|nr:hypothetical protein [Armatimonadota bacterium]
MGRIIALILLVITVIGLAHAIEVTARPDTGREGRHISGEHEH